MRQHQVGRLTYNVKNPLLEDVEARMQVEPVRFDTHLARHFHRRAATYHGIRENARMERLEYPVHVTRAVPANSPDCPRVLGWEKKGCCPTVMHRRYTTSRRSPPADFYSRLRPTQQLPQCPCAE
jgi:hypothetical protein